MAIAIVDDVGLALDVTREYLRRRSPVGYLALAVLALLLGPVGVGAPPGPVEVRTEAYDVRAGEVPSWSAVVDAVGGEAVVVGVVVVGLLLGGTYLLAGAFAEFAVVHSLIADAVAVREPARRHWRRAVELFVFRLLAGLITAGSLASLVVAIWGLDVAPVRSPWGVVVLGLLGVVGYLLHRVTTDLAVPIMLGECRSLVGAWGRVLGLASAHPRALAGYVLVRLALAVAAAVGMGIAVGVALLGLGLIVGVPVFVLLALVTDLWLALVLTAVVLVPVAVLLVGAVLAPFHVYFRYYAMLVLGDIDETLDFVADWREHVAADPSRVAGRL